MSLVSSIHSTRQAREFYLVLDWDGTITRRDTVGVLAEIGYQKRQTLVSQDQSLEMIPPWNYFVQAYMKDYSTHVSSYKPVKEDRLTVAEESAWLGSLQGIETASVERVNKAGIFKCLMKEDIDKTTMDAVRTLKVELRPGWRDLLLTRQSDNDCQIKVWISSVNWSGTFISACVNAAVDLEDSKANYSAPPYEVYCNDLEGLASVPPQAATGIIGPGSNCSLSGVHTSTDKAHLLKELRLADGETLQESSSDMNRGPLIVYVGDSATDFDSLVDADIGICIQDEPLSSSQKELKETFTRLGFQFFEVSDRVKLRTQLQLLEKKDRAIWTAKDLHEVSTFVNEIASRIRNHPRPKPSRFPTTYAKHFIPLESDPEIFTELAHSLGLSEDWSFHDVLSLEDPDLLTMVPRPVHALVLVFPTSEAYETRKVEEEATRDDYDANSIDEPVIWFRQTINNACGLYGLLHAVCNEPPVGLISMSEH